MNYGATLDRCIQKTFTDMLLFVAFEFNAVPFEYFLCMTPFAMPQPVPKFSDGIKCLTIQTQHHHRHSLSSAAHPCHPAPASRPALPLHRHCQ